jgi:hypothetical protein
MKTLSKYHILYLQRKLQGLQKQKDLTVEQEIKVKAKIDVLRELFALLQLDEIDMKILCDFEDSLVYKEKMNENAD